LTGIEALIGTALAKAAGAGAGRAIGWTASAALGAAHRARTARKIEDALGVLGVEDAEISHRIVEFAAAPEMEHYASALTAIYMLNARNSKSEAALADLENEFYFALEAWLQAEPPTGVTRLMFRAISEAVLTTINGLSIPKKLPAALEAELIKTAGSLAAASVRNTELLRNLTQLSQILGFQSEFRSQCSALHRTMSLPHAGTTRRIAYKSLFVPPHLHATERGDSDFSLRHADKPLTLSKEPPPISIEESTSVVTRIVILGDPGGGKSTLANKLVYDVSAGKIESLANRAAFLITLRDYAPHSRGAGRVSLSEYIGRLCATPYGTEAPDGAIEYLLSNGRAVVIFDGLDELLDTDLRRDVVQAVEGFAHRYPTCPIVVTSRRVGYGEAPLDHELFHPLELGEFSQPQIEKYVKNWFKLEGRGTTHQKSSLANSFLNDSRFVDDLRKNPLMLSLMCGIYATEGYIPHNRPDVYEKCAVLLFESWDKQRGILPTLPFDAHVRAAMRSLALYMFTEHPTEPALPREKLVSHISEYLRRKRFADEVLAENAANEFVDFCRGRAWVLTDVGSELYGFTHRTFLEYFAASQLVRENADAAKLAEKLLPHLIDQSWDVVSQLSLQILNKTVEDGADDFLDLILRAAGEHTGESGRSARNNLLGFAARSLQFIVPRPSTLHHTVDAIFDANRVDLEDYDRAEYFILTTLMEDCSSENRPRVADRLRNLVAADLENSEETDDYALFVALRPAFNSGLPDWMDWASDNMQVFKREIERRQVHHTWLAVFSFEDGALELPELVNIAGADAFFCFRIRETVMGPPLAYRLVSALREYGELYSELRSAYVPVRPIDPEELAELLHELPKPWFGVSNDLNGLVQSATSQRSNKQPSPSVQRLTELMLLPLFEVLIHRNTDAERAGRHPFEELITSLKDERRRNLVRARTSGILGSEIFELPSKRGSGWMKHNEFVGAWSRGEFSLVAFDHV